MSALSWSESALHPQRPGCRALLGNERSEPGSGELGSSAGFDQFRAEIRKRDGFHLLAVLPETTQESVRFLAPTQEPAEPESRWDTRTVKFSCSGTVRLFQISPMDPITRDQSRRSVGRASRKDVDSTPEPLLD